MMMTLPGVDGTSASPAWELDAAASALGALILAASVLGASVLGASASGCSAAASCSGARLGDSAFADPCAGCGAAWTASWTASAEAASGSVRAPGEGGKAGPRRGGARSLLG